MSKKVIITIAPTGNFQGKNANPALPEQPDEIAQAVEEAYKEGAAITHVHARDVNGRATNDPEIFYKINKLIKERCDIIIQNSIAPALGDTPAEEGLAILETMPEMASLDMGICCVYFEGFEQLIQWTRTFLRKAASMMLERKIKPEMEIYNPSNMVDVESMIEEGLFKPPYLINFVMNMHKVNQGAVPYTPQNLMHYITLLPPDAMFNVMGIGPAQLPSTTLSMLLGGHCRVGFEDNIFYDKGALAQSNAQLVARSVRIAKELGLEIATPDEAREMLGIKK